MTGAPAADPSRSSVDRAHEALRENILSGTYAPGSRLVLSRLAHELGMSFIPVREALQRLESERLVRSSRNRGARVAPLSIEDMRDIYETRLVLEDHALRTAMQRLDPATIDHAEQALHGMERGFARGDQPAAFASHQDFHFALYRPAGSAWTLHLIGQLWSSAERYVRLAASVRGDPAEFVAEHASILEAVTNGDVDTAAARLSDNLRTTERLLTAAYPTTVRSGRRATTQEGTA
jgi:GntR family transcriptional regulator, carbon starvation induced regulator